MLDLVRKRHEILSDKYDAVYMQFLEAVNPFAVTKFWEKWHQVKALMEISSSVRMIVACDADVIWNKDEDIFNVLPDDEDFGITWQKAQPTYSALPSAGCVWIRNTERNRALVDSILSLEPEFERQGGEDQSAMLRALFRQGRKAFRLPDLLHAPSGDAILHSFHCQPDRYAKMESVALSLSPILPVDRSRILTMRPA